jgi:hypothetical protein
MMGVRERMSDTHICHKLFLKQWPEWLFYKLYTTVKVCVTNCVCIV